MNTTERVRMREIRTILFVTQLLEKGAMETGENEKKKDKQKVAKRQAKKRN